MSELEKQIDNIKDESPMTKERLESRVMQLLYEVKYGGKDTFENVPLTDAIVSLCEQYAASQVRSALASATKLVAGHTKISGIPLSELELFWHEDREVRLRRRKDQNEA